MGNGVTMELRVAGVTQFFSVSLSYCTYSNLAVLYIIFWM